MPTPFVPPYAAAAIKKRISTLVPPPTRLSKKPTSKLIGRPPGAVGQISLQAKAYAMSTGFLPHELLLMWARGEPILQNVDGKEEDVYLSVDQRIDCAKAAAPFYTPRLQAVQATIHGSLELEAMSDAELDAKLLRLSHAMVVPMLIADSQVTDLEVIVAD